MFGKAVCVAAVIAGAGMAPVMAWAGVVVAAPESDYPQFRKLADRLRLTDMLAALIGDHFRADAAAKSKSPVWQAAFQAAVDRDIAKQREAITDTIMREDFKAFSHDEVTRLVAIAAGPFPQRYQAAWIEVLRKSGDPAPIAAMLRDDPDSLAMSEADRALYGRFMAANRGGYERAMAQLRPDLLQALVEADAAASRPVPKGR